MIKKIFFFCLLIFVHQRLLAATVSGRIFDAMGTPLNGVSIALLYPSDSTLATFAITNKEGSFHINDANEAHYILQASMAGYYTEYEKIDIAKGEITKLIPAIVLQKNVDEHKLNEVVISGERVPISIKGDTVEYNASSYRVKPNAPVEDLLRQLPGVQVDEKGNIKSMGKEVKKIMVDGKDFFGTDPKIATENLPADAIDKVQTFGKHSDQSEFSGIDDGSREQTINLTLKEGKRKGYFGELKAGVATGEHYDANAKVFQFRPKKQIAALGSLNNINQFGFSFNDYINFNGGIGNLMNGGSLSNLDDMPVDFGQPVTGKNTSGALGLNYAVEPRAQNRFSVNYIGSGLSKIQDNNTLAKNYLPSGVDYITEEVESLKKESLTNSITAKWNNQVDSFNQIVFSLNGQLKNDVGSNKSNSLSLISTDTINTLEENNRESAASAKLNTTASWVHKLQKQNWKIFQTNASLIYLRENMNYDWNNTTTYIAPRADLFNHQFQDNNNNSLQSALDFSTAYRLWNNVYAEPKLGFAYSDESLLRRQGDFSPQQEAIDSLSPQIENRILHVAPAIYIKNGSSKQQWNIGVEGKKIWMTPDVKNNIQRNNDFRYLLPSVFWRRELGLGKSIELSYNTNLRNPKLNELLPVLYYSSPLSGIKGSLDLKPEYHHNGHFAYMHFNQFEMSSLFASINGAYIKDKINAALTILPNLGQQALWMNTRYAANMRFEASYSRPIKGLGLDINVELQEMAQISEGPVNEVLNENTAITHQFGLTFNNRKNRDKWNTRIGADIQISDSRYSINKELNNVFYNYSGFTYLSYQPDKKWFFAFDAKLKYYTAQSFDETISIPLLSAEITRHILPFQRASVTLRAFDLLNRNQAVIRQGLSNHLVEQTSTVLQRYFMLTFAYKLNKVGKS